MNSARARSLVVAGVSSFIVLASTLPAAAVAPAPASQVSNTTNTLKISPVRSDITILPGSTQLVPVTVYNTTKTPVVLKAIENDFIAKDEAGTPAIILDENSYAPTHSLKRFMVPVANVTVPAGGSLDVKVNIVVPKSAQAGGYFGALRFAPAAETGGKQVNLGASVVSLILLTVPGPTTEQLQLTNFNIQQNGGTASNFRTPNNLSLLLRFENKGNLQEAPFGQIYVKKGKKVTYTNNFNQADPKSEVLPDSARRWTVPLKGLGKFGKYTVGATFGYGTKGQSLEIQKTIWIVPTTYIFVGLGSILALVLIVSGVLIFMKSYKRRILRASRRR